jgi:DNA repair exonuclease SbcCD ATPase subunit
LWGIDNLRVSVDEYVGEDFRLVESNTVAKVGNVYNAFRELGYSFINDGVDYFEIYQHGLWLDYENQKLEVAERENVLNNGEKYDEVVAEIDEIIVALKEQVKAYSAESEGLVAELEKIDEEIKAVIEAADEVTDEAKLELLVAKQLVIDALEELQAQLKELNIERQSLNTEMGRYNSMASTYRGYIAKYYAAEAGVTLPTFAKSEAIQAAFTAQIQAFEQEIIDATEDLNETLEALEQIYNGTDDDNVYFEQQLEKAKAEVEEIEAQIEERLAEIEKYEELLKGTLAAFAGETTPEA